MSLFAKHTAPIYIGMFLVLVTVATAAAVLRLSAPHPVHAASAGDLFGYAWSDMPCTITGGVPDPGNCSDETKNPSSTAVGRGAGWISFSCTNDSSCGTSDYGVTVDTATGLVSGDAWADKDHIGWISFNPSDVSGCPTPESGGRCQAKVDLDPSSPTKGKVTGWARALAAPAAGTNAGGWDGWIHLSGSNYGVMKDMTAGDGCSWSGYAWGGPVLGWIEFNPSAGSGVKGGKAGCNAITAFISADKTSVVAPGNPVNLTWGSSNAVSCTGSNFSTGGAVSGGPKVVNPTVTTIYSVTCSGPSGSSVAKVLVNVPTPSAALSLVASPSSIQSGKQITLNWSATNVDPASCSIDHGIGSVSGTTVGGVTSGSVSNAKTVINGPTTFTLTCDSTVPPVGPTSTSVTVGVIPTIIEPQ